MVGNFSIKTGKGFEEYKKDKFGKLKKIRIRTKKEVGKYVPPTKEVGWEQLVTGGKDYWIQRKKGDRWK